MTGPARIPLPMLPGLWSPKEIKEIAGHWRKLGFIRIGLSQEETIYNWETRNLKEWREKYGNDGK